MVGDLLADAGAYRRLARQLCSFDNFLFLGRGINSPIAMEGALKLKELSYIHAEGYPAGEMKHGPIALIDRGMATVALAPQDSMYPKVVNNIKEVKARDGLVVAVVTQGDRDLPSQVDHVLSIPPGAGNPDSPCWPSFPCNCWPTTSPSSGAATLTSPETWPNRSPWNRVPVAWIFRRVRTGPKMSSELEFCEFWN